MEELKQEIRKELEIFELPDVLEILILEFVGGRYELSDLNRLPYGVVHSCILRVNIHMSRKMVMWCKRSLYKDDKIYVTRSEGEFEDEFTFKFTIDKKSYTLLHGVMRLHRGVDILKFIPEPSVSVVIYKWLM